MATSSRFPSPIERWSHAKTAYLRHRRLQKHGRAVCVTVIGTGHWKRASAATSR
jgi:hypothetical protein